MLLGPNLIGFLIFFYHIYVASSLANSSNDDLSITGAFRAKVRSEFDWRAYLEIYQDLAKHFSTREEALFHFLKFGRKEGRRFPKIFPNQPSLGIAHRKLTRFIKYLDNNNIPVEDRTFVIYYIDSVGHKYSLEVFVNNVRIFNSSIIHDIQELQSGFMRTNFYWFNIIGGVDNVLRPYLPLDLDNVAEVDWNLAPSDMFMHFRTLGLFKHVLEIKFGSVLFTNYMVRGPLVLRKEGQWLKEFRRILFAHNNGIVGSTISCEHTPHVQTHLFMIRTSVIPIILAEYTTFRKFDDSVSLQRRYEVGVTETIQRNGFNFSSVLTENMLKTSFFDGRCINKPESSKSLDPTRWCEVTPEQVVFLKWGGEILRSGFLCDDMKKRMIISLSEMTRDNVPLIFPETLNGGTLLHLYKEYDREMLLDARAKDQPQTIKIEDLSYRVCFLIRTAQMHEIQANRTLVETVEEEGIDGIVKSLLRQSDPNWGGFFFITDDKPFDRRLKEILGKFNDPRIEYLDVPLQYRPKYSPVDAGYTPTDYVLRYLVQRQDCQWLSASNADNIYGTDIVKNVRQTFLKPEPDEGVPEMVLAPLDSRNFPEQDYRIRNEKTAWDHNCVGMVAMFNLHELGYTVQPRPFVAKVDLAAVFFSRPKLQAENIFFGNFTDPDRFPCKGCQDGYFTEYLSRTRLWKYKRLPIDGMRSIVFHGPSPTWCLAGGHVWFDHPDVGGVRCYSQRIVDQIRALDVQPNAIFDWKYFDDNNRLCLRFSNLGFLRNAAGLAQDQPAPQQPASEARRY